MNIETKLYAAPVEATLTEFTLVLTMNNYRASVAFDSYLKVSFFTINPTKELFNSIEEWYEHSGVEMRLVLKILSFMALIKPHEGKYHTKEAIELLLL